MEKGHTFNENDSIHACIESASRHIKFYTTPQWAATMRVARRDHPYKVKEMSQRDFFYFKSMASQIKNFDFNTDGEKVVWNKLKVVSLRSENPNMYAYKTHHSGEEYHVNMFHRLRSELPDPHKMTLAPIRCEEIPISKKKIADLQFLYQTNHSSSPPWLLSAATT